MAQTSFNWCWTLNNPTPEEIAECKVIDCKYCCFAQEVGEAGTPHLQGFIVTNKRSRLSALKKLIPRAHFTLCKGTAQQNIDYCSKDGELFEYGEKPKSKAELGLAEKERWTRTVAAAKAGKLDEVPEDIYCRYYKTLKEIAKDHMKKPEDAGDVTGVWYYGEAGAGKSRAAREDYPGAYLKMANKWWDGYQGEEYVILDDLEKDHGEAFKHLLKIWCDRYSFLAENKGGAVHIRPKKIIITSQYHPYDLWQDDETRAAMMRRFTLKLFGNYTPSVVVTPNSVSVRTFRKIK